MLDVLEARIRLFVAEYAKRRVFVHSGVVAWKDRAILIPGRSYSGKSTLVAEFVKAGAKYYSDEYAVIDEKGRVHPFLKPIALRDQEGESRSTNHPIEEFGGVAGRKPLSVGCVLVTEYRPEARLRLREISHGKAILSLIANTVPARRIPETVFATLDRSVANAVAYKGVRSEAREVVERLLSADWS